VQRFAAKVRWYTLLLALVGDDADITVRAADGLTGIRQQ
jgi:hypothetical protein